MCIFTHFTNRFLYIWNQFQRLVHFQLNVVLCKAWLISTVWTETWKFRQNNRAVIGLYFRKISTFLHLHRPSRCFFIFSPIITATLFLLSLNLLTFLGFYLCLIYTSMFFNMLFFKYLPISFGKSARLKCKSEYIFCLKRKTLIKAETIRNVTLKRQRTMLRQAHK